MKHVLWLLALLLLAGCGEFPTQEDEDNDDCYTTQSSYDDDCDDDDDHYPDDDDDLYPDDDDDPYRPQSGVWKGSVTDIAGTKANMHGLVTRSKNMVAWYIPEQDIIHVGHATGNGSNYTIERLHTFSHRMDAFLIPKATTNGDLRTKANVLNNSHMVGNSYRGSTQVSSFDVRVAGNVSLALTDIDIGTWDSRVRIPASTDTNSTATVAAATLELKDNGAFSINVVANNCTVSGAFAYNYRDDDDDYEYGEGYEDDDQYEYGEGYEDDDRYEYGEGYEDDDRYEYGEGYEDDDRYEYGEGYEDDDRYEYGEGYEDDDRYEYGEGYEDDDRYEYEYDERTHGASPRDYDLYYNNRLLHAKATATNCSDANLNGDWSLYVGKDGDTLIIAGQKGSEYVAYGEFRR